MHILKYFFRVSRAVDPDLAIHMGQELRAGCALADMGPTFSWENGANIDSMTPFNPLTDPSSYEFMMTLTSAH